MSLIRRRKSPGWGSLGKLTPTLPKTVKLTKKIVNPISKRKINLGGPKHKELIKNGILDKNGKLIHQSKKLTVTKTTKATKAIKTIKTIKTEKDLSYLANISVDMARKILSDMTYDDILEACSVNKYFETKVCNDVFWKSLVREKFNMYKFTELPLYVKSWAILYGVLYNVINKDYKHNQDFKVGLFVNLGRKYSYSLRRLRDRMPGMIVNITKNKKNQLVSFKYIDFEKKKYVNVSKKKKGWFFEKGDKITIQEMKYPMLINKSGNRIYHTGTKIIYYPFATLFVIEEEGTAYVQDDSINYTFELVDIINTSELRVRLIKHMLYSDVKLKKLKDVKYITSKSDFEEVTWIEKINEIVNKKMRVENVIMIGKNTAYEDSVINDGVIYLKNPGAGRISQGLKYTDFNSRDFYFDKYYEDDDDRYSHNIPLPFFKFEE